MRNLLVEDVRARVARLVPGFESMLKRPPATHADIEALAAAIGHDVPPLLADWLRSVNGETAGLAFAPGWTFLSTDEIALHHGLFADAAARISPITPFTPHGHRVRMPPSYGVYTPFAADHLGNLLALDGDPLGPSFADQVLFVSREQLGIRVVAAGLEALLTELRDNLASGAVTVEDGKIRFPGPGGMLRPWMVRARAFAAQPWQPTAGHHTAAASLSPAWRSAAYAGQNDILQTEAFPADDLDLVFAVSLTPELLADADTLRLFPNLTSIRVDGDANPEVFGAMAALPLTTLTLVAASPAGLRGIEAFGAGPHPPTLTTLYLSSADQEAFDAACTIASLRDLTVTGSTVGSLARIGALAGLYRLHVSGTGRPDPTPAYVHPTIRELVLAVTW